jgi:hypothetical protein
MKFPPENWQTAALMGWRFFVLPRVPDVPKGEKS